MLEKEIVSILSYSLSPFFQCLMLKTTYLTGVFFSQIATLIELSKGKECPRVVVMVV